MNKYKFYTYLFSTGSLIFSFLFLGIENWKIFSSIIMISSMVFLILHLLMDE